MYSRLPHHIFSLGRFLAVFALLVLVMVEEGYGQKRIYAVLEQQSLSGLASVTNPERAIDSDTSNFSTLNILLSILGSSHASQNLTFTNPMKPLPRSPIGIKFGTPTVLVDLLGTWSVTRTNGGINSQVAPSYSNSYLLNLLDGGSEAILIVNPTGAQYDGVSLRIDGTVAVTARLFYAFHITQPHLQGLNLIEDRYDIELCNEQIGTLNIDINPNYRDGVYTYQVYDGATGGNPVSDTFESDTLTIPATLPAGTYWLEARENNIYPSARRELKVIRRDIPGITLLPIAPICEGETVAALGYSNVSNSPDQYNIVWDSGAPPGFTNVTDATLPTSPISIPIPASAAMGEYTGTLTVRNTETDCESIGYPFTVTVLPQPGRPHLTITDVQN